MDLTSLICIAVVVFFGFSQMIYFRLRKKYGIDLALAISFIFGLLGSILFVLMMIHEKL